MQYNSTLQFFLEKNILKFTTDGIITLESPVSISDPVSTPTISVYLYRKMQNIYNKNSLNSVGSGDTESSDGSPLAIDLFYMLTPLRPKFHGGQ